MQDGLGAAFNLFQKVKSQVVAYRKFLKKYNFNVSKVKNTSDFHLLPIIDKSNYLSKYRLEDLFVTGKVPPMAYASSGSTGTPTFWFRGDKQEETGARIHDFIFTQGFELKKYEKTLVVICFSMGVWIAGNFTTAVCRKLARDGWNLSVITPGVEKEDIFHILKSLSPNFENVVLAGYPAFLMDVVKEAKQRGIRLDFNVKVLTAGDSFTEEWRDALARLLKIKDIFHSIISIYGSADAGIMGHETPVSIFIRRRATEDRELFTDLFGDSSVLPALLQYHPEDIFFEEINGELILTAETGIPLVRYNIRDVGHLLPQERIYNQARERGLLPRAIKSQFENLNLPFLVKKSRTDVAVTFYALNIYPEQIIASLEDKRIAKFLSGNFISYNKTVSNHSVQKLFFELELSNKIRPNEKLAKIATACLVEGLTKRSIEYRKLFNTIGRKAIPEIKLRTFRNKPFWKKHGKGLLYIKGKKPKIITEK